MVIPFFVEELQVVTLCRSWHSLLINDFIVMFQNIEAHSSDASQLTPQHNYRLDVHSLNARHPGEV